MTREHSNPGRPRKLLIWVVCVLLILIGSSFLFISHIEGSQGQATHASVKATATATPTEPTSTPTATADASSTDSATPQPIFSDYFVNNDKGWLVGEAAGTGYNRTIDLNGLTLSATNHKILIESLPGNNMYDDFQLETTFTFQPGDTSDSMGIYLRGDSNLDHDYRVDIYGNNTFAISKESLDANHNPIVTYLVTPTHTPALKPLGQENTLQVFTKGSTILLMINDQQVSSVTDTDYTHGQIALFVQNGDTSKGVLSIFGHILIYPAPEQLPDATNTEQETPTPTSPAQ